VANKIMRQSQEWLQNFTHNVTFDLAHPSRLVAKGDFKVRRFAITDPIEAWIERYLSKLPTRGGRSQNRTQKSARVAFAFFADVPHGNASADWKCHNKSHRVIPRRLCL
jgi:hypothetical protein